MLTKTLVKALRDYGRPAFDGMQNLVILEENGVQISISIWQACNIAADWLDEREHDGLKFRALLAGMKELGIEDLYEQIMHEEVP